MNGMSRFFVGLGLVVMAGFLVVEFLPGIKNLSMANLGSSKPSAVSYLLKSLEPQQVCGFPIGEYTLSIPRGTSITIKDNAGTYTNPITGGRSYSDDRLPFQEKSDYFWGILFDGKPNGDMVKIPDTGCIDVRLNINPDHPKLFGWKVVGSGTKLSIEAK